MPPEGESAAAVALTGDDPSVDFPDQGEATIAQREVHHGPAFWTTLGRTMPDWQKRKDNLAEKAKDYLVFGLMV